MHILDRYIRIEVIKKILIVAVALVGFDYFFNFVQELKIVGRGHYTLIQAFLYMSLTMPSRFYALFPWAALIGSLWNLGIMANRSELVVMRTGGLSVFRITQALLQGGIVLTLAVLMIGEGVAPLLDRFADARRLSCLSGGQSMQTNEGLWVKQGSQFIHIDRVNSDGQLFGITRYQFNENYRLKEALFAAQAKQIAHTKEWLLTGIKATRFLKDKTETFKKESELLPSLVEAEILETAKIKHPERLSIWTLWRAITHRSRHQLNTQVYVLAFWAKIFQPLVIMMMIFLGASFVFGPLRSVSMGSRLVVGILVGFLFHTLNHVFSPIAVMYSLQPILAVLCPLLLFGGVGCWLLWRVR